MPLCLAAAAVMLCRAQQPGRRTPRGAPRSPRSEAPARAGRRPAPPAARRRSATPSCGQRAPLRRAATSSTPFSSQSCCTWRTRRGAALTTTRRCAGPMGGAGIAPDRASASPPQAPAAAPHARGGGPCSLPPPPAARRPPRPPARCRAGPSPGSSRPRARRPPASWRWTAGSCPCTRASTGRAPSSTSYAGCGGRAAQPGRRAPRSAPGLGPRRMRRWAPAPRRRRGRASQAPGGFAALQRRAPRLR
jgi:hypothetical protein